MEERFVRETGQAGTIAEIAEPVLADLGYRLVRVILSSRDGGTLQIMADCADRDFVVEDCAIISRELDPVLDAYAGDVRLKYSLEVSSPGIDRPLVRPSDVEAYAGFEAKVELKETIDGRRRFRGMIDGFEDGEFRLSVLFDGESEPRVLGFPARMIESAKLVMTDELIRHGAELRAQADETDDADDSDATGLDDDIETENDRPLPDVLTKLAKTGDAT